MTGDPQDHLRQEKPEHKHKENLPQRKIERHGLPFENVRHVDRQRRSNRKRISRELRAVRCKGNGRDTKKKGRLKMDALACAPALRYDTARTKFHEPTRQENKDYSQTDHP